MTDRRIGVFICHCGGNISDYVDVEKVRKAIENDPGVVIARTHMFTCSDAAQQEMIDDIKELELDGLVVASCSPKLHLYTFRQMAKRGDLNPYQYVQVNLREQDSWTHRHDWDAATEKGVRLVRAGIANARLTRPLVPYRIQTTPKVLVIGAGIAGLRAALGLSDLGLAVYLIEREAEIGGWAAKWGKMFPNDKRGSDLVEQLLEQVKARDNITLFTNAALVEKGGSIGDFSIKMEVAGQETISDNVGAIIVATGFEPYTPDDGEFGFGQEGVLTLPDFDQLIAKASGPLVHNGTPVKDIVYIHCVGSRQTQADVENPNLYCSRYCCTAGVHASHDVRELIPGVRQYHLYRDMRTYGKYELLYEEARQKGSIFIGYDVETPPKVERVNGKQRVTVIDQLTGGEELEIDADLVVLLTGMVARENGALVDILKLPIGLDGFFNEIHPKLRPVETLIDGVFIAGTCQGPKNLAESVGAALSSVSKSAGLLMKGYLDLEPLIAKIDTDLCEWCGACEEACPYDAIEKVKVEGKEIAVVTQSLCKGGGPCVPVCPKDAIDIEGYTDAQIRSMITALLQEVA